MDHRVSPCTTAWVVPPGSCWAPAGAPAGAGAGEGAARPVSCAGFEVSGRACVVSCARSPGATTPTPPIPTSSPATRASRAARSERQVVVLFTQRLGECLERLRLALRRRLGSDLGPALLAPFAPTPPLPPPP